MNRKEEILFNDGVWYAIQFLVVERDEPVYARDLVRDLNLSKQEMRRCQKKSGFLDEIMYKFINECE